MTSVAFADEITVGGYSNGAFNGNAPNTAPPPAQSATLLGLTYTNSTFNQTTAGGFAAFGTAPATPNSDNLGSFTLSSAVNNYTGNTFNLRLTFTVPTGINGSNTTQFVATLTGMVISTTQGGVFIDFDNTPQFFTFSSGGVGGSFTFTVNDVSITPGGNVAVTGFVRGSAPDGGATVALLGMALVGVAAFRRKLSLS